MSAIDLSDNANLWGPPPAAARALAELGPSALSRYPGPFAPSLKEALAERLGVDAECIALGCGSDELIEAAFRLLVGAGRTVAYRVPTFSMVEPFAKGAGLRTVTERSFAELSGAKADAVYLCSPNNPTGEALTQEAVRAFVAGMPSLTFLDEAYVEFSSQPSLAQWAPAAERLLVFRTFSKAWGLAGLRVGYAVGAPPLIRRLEALRGPFTVNAVAQRVALAALTDDAWVKARAQEARSAVEELSGALRSRGFAPLPSDANFVLVPTVRARGLAEALLRRGVRVRFLPDLPGIGDALRIAVGPPDAMGALYRALDEVLS